MDSFFLKIRKKVEVCLPSEDQLYPGEIDAIVNELHQGKNDDVDHGSLNVAAVTQRGQNRQSLSIYAGPKFSNE